MEREKCGTTCHIRGQTCSLTTRSLTEFYYIHKITNTCLPNYSERRSGKSWELVTPSLHQSSDVALDIEKLLKYKENHLSLCVNRSTFFFLLEQKLSVRWSSRISCLSYSVNHEEDRRRHQNYRKAYKPWGRGLNWSDWFRNFEFANLVSQDFGKFAIFLLVLDLMQECYVISLPEFYLFLIRRSACFVKYFHIAEKLSERDWHTVLNHRRRESN